MNKRPLLFMLALILVFSSCGRKEQTQTDPAAFAAYVTAYTSNVISTDDNIIVRLSANLRESHNESDRLFRLEPSVRGSEMWLDERTVAFVPDAELKSGTAYRVFFNLSRLVEIPEGLEVFLFDFRTISQDMEVRIEGISAVDDPDAAESPRKRFLLTGRVLTANAAEPARVHNTLSARLENRPLELVWESDTRNRVHHFTVTGIDRLQEAARLAISWDGNPIGAGSVKGSETIEIPPSDAFELIQTRVIRDANPRVELVFSDPVDPAQNLRGLIRIDDDDQLNFVTANNRIEVYPRKVETGARTLHIEPSISSKEGKRLGTRISRTIQLHQLLPAVRLTGKGVIIPVSDVNNPDEGLLLPFEAVNLAAVDVRIVRIFENNIAQFLQESRLDGSSWRLNRVGRTVHRQTLPLASMGTFDPDATGWNSYALDLSKLIIPEPGAIYRVSIGFRRHHSLFPCAGEERVEVDRFGFPVGVSSAGSDEDENWDTYEYYPAGYDWQQRDNPCHVSYYNPSRTVSRNVLASNFGIIAKQGDVGSLLVAVTDLKTAAPRHGVTLDIYDYQQQVMNTVSTDTRGMASVKTERKPFLIVARHGNERGYLRVDDGVSLSLSDFDVSGMRVSEGIKGFLYTERGVWRPGDSLFVTLMLEDKQNLLPDNHPVIFELRDPSGQTRDRRVFSQSLNGFYSYKTKTDRDAQTGNWAVQARVGGNTFSKSLKIETVRPNRLKVELKTGQDKITQPGRRLDATIFAQWLHGAAARGLNADVSLTLSQVSRGFKNFPRYVFDDPSRSLDAPSTEIFKGKLDESGKTSFSYRFNRSAGTPGDLQAQLLTRVFEESGNFSVNRSAIPYYPYETMVGVRLPETDRWGSLDPAETHTVDIVTVDTDGNPRPHVNLRMTVYRIDWRWWWERSREDLSSYFARRNIRPLIEENIFTGADGRGTSDFRLEDYWGRFLIRVSDPAGGHSTGHIFYLGWGRRDDDESGGPTRLTFTSDKENYSVGEEITLSIPGSAGGRALVSLETGTRILDSWWTDLLPGDNRVRFMAKKEMSPNVYAHVTLLQPHAQTDNDLPIRMYGVIPVPVENPETMLSPTVQLPDEIRPESSITIEIGEENGRDMTYTIAVVDEGLLDLTNFATPRPHKHFYAREALGVKTWDMFEFVAGRYAGSMSRILAVGGDAELTRLEQPAEVIRFEPMVRYLGPFYLKKGTKNRHTVDIPNYIGSVRTMVIAGQQGAYGQADKTTPVRKPLMVLGTLPRVLGPGEHVSLPVTVFAMKENLRDVDVIVRTSDIFNLDGPRRQTVTFAQTGDKVIEYTLAVDKRTGAGSVEIEVRSGGESAYHRIDIEVRNPNPPVFRTYDKVLDEGEDWEIGFDAVGLPGTNSGVLEISRLPSIDLERRLNYLVNYPHGCLEQIVSSLFAQLYIVDLTELSDIRKREIQGNIESGILRIRNFILAGGGLSLWPGRSDVNQWTTSYTYHFLLEAKAKGYEVPGDLLININRYQRQTALNWRRDEQRQYADLLQAYRLYTLALSNTPELGAMNRMREHGNINKAARWRLAAAYALAGQHEAASDLVKGIDMEIEQYRELSRTFGSRLRDRAMILETLILMNRREDAFRMVMLIAGELNEYWWHSTQSTGYALVSISKFVNSIGVDDEGEIKAYYRLDGTGEGIVQSDKPLTQVRLDIGDKGRKLLHVKNNGKGMFFARLITVGTPMTGDTTAVSHRLSQTVRYLTMDEKEVDPSKLGQGMDIIAEVTVRNTSASDLYHELAITQIFPSGWEIRNTRLDEIVFEKPSSVPTYQDIRDDRVYTYFDLEPRQSKTFRVVVNAAYRGAFYLPAVSTYAMYDETINARTPGKWVNVVRPE